MAIISEYKEDSEDVESKVHIDEDGDDEDEGEDSEDEEGEVRSSDATSSVRPYDEVLVFLLQEHQQQLLRLLSTVIEFLYRETGIGAQEGVHARVSEMLISAARRQHPDTGDSPDVVGVLDKAFEESVESSKDESVEDKDTVIITPVEYPHVDICEEDSRASNILCANDNDNHSFEADTATITLAEDVLVTTNLACKLESNAVDILSKNEKVDEKCTKPKDLDPNSGNGADLEKYSWTQTLYDTTLLIPVRMGVNAKSIVCDIQPRYLKVCLKGETPLLEGDLNKPVKPSECFWNLEDGKLLVVHLQKHYTMDWWHIVFEGEPEIDVTKVILPQASLSDLHPDTRQHIEHVLFEQQEAVKELPNSDKGHKDDALHKFMSESLELYA